MPISPHVLRRLQEALGMDAASELANLADTMEATRADLAEFRHEMRRELDVIKVRLDTMATRADVAELRAELRTELKSEIGGLRSEMKGEIGTLRAEMKDALLLQTRWILAGLLTVILAIYFRP